MKNNYTRRRLKEIIAVSVKYGLKNGINDPKAFRLALEELGPTFIKLGQILSTRPDIIPKSYIKELEKLQDNVTPENFNIMKKEIEKELGANLEDLFLYFNEKPIASASLAEVYYAKLKSGEKIVVKVQRPFVREKMMSDIAILKKLAPFIKFTTSGNFIDVEEAIEELNIAAEKELDFLNEVKNINLFSENNKNIRFITVPKTYEDYCSKKVIVMDYIDGIKVDQVEKLELEGYDLQDMAKKLIYSYIKQILEDGFFHADPHPGNLIIHNNKIGFIDFGLMGFLDPNLKNKFNEFIEAIAEEDYNKMTRIVLKIGIQKGPVDIKVLRSDIENMYNQYMEQSIYDFDLPEMIEEIFHICKRNNIHMPKNVTLLIKGLMTLQGVIVKLDKEISIMDVTLPYVQNHLIKEKLGNINFLDGIKYIYTIVKSNLEISTKLLDLIEQTINGRFKLNLQVKNMEKSINELNKMVNRLVFAIIVAALVVSSSLAMNVDVGLKIYGISIVGLVGYLGAAIAGFWLLISILRSGKL